MLRLLLASADVRQGPYTMPLPKRAWTVDDVASARRSSRLPAGDTPGGSPLLACSNCPEEQSPAKGPGCHASQTRNASDEPCLTLDSRIRTRQLLRPVWCPRAPQLNGSSATGVHTPTTPASPTWSAVRRACASSACSPRSQRAGKRISPVLGRRATVAAAVRARPLCGQRQREL